MGSGKYRAEGSYAGKRQKMVAGKDKQLLKEIKRLETVEYGMKEFIHGLLIGLIIGFFLAMMLLK